VTDQVLDQALGIGRIPQQDQAHVTFLRRRFESARPVPAVIRLDVGMNGRFQRAFEPGEVVCERATQWSPRHTLHVFTGSEWRAGLARRSPLRVERIDQFRIPLQITLDESVEFVRNVGHARVPG